MTSVTSAAQWPCRVVVVGNGMVGHQFIESLLGSEQANHFDITVIGEEPRVAYDRVHLTEYFQSLNADNLAMTTKASYEQRGIRVYLHEKVTGIDRAAKTVTTSSGALVGYDKLVLATGSFPFVPQIPGNDRKNCFVYRTIEDLEAITKASEEAKRGVVIGGGLLGLEAAKALRDLELEVDVIEFAPRLMAAQLDDAGADVLRKKIEALGVGVHLNKATREIVDGTEYVHRMNFTDDSFLDTDLIIFSAGIRPRDELARQAELAMGERGGIVINDVCQTSDESIYSIGECALWDGKIFGLVGPGYTMARVAADHLLGGVSTFAGADMSTKLKLMGVDVASIGDAHVRTPGALTYVYQNQPAEVYKKLVVDAENKRVIGAVLIGDTSDYDTLLQYMLNAIELPDSPEALILPAGSGAEGKPMLGAAALPDAANICSCYSVSKGAIRGAVEGGCCSVADVKGTTKAGTGCGGCVQLLTQVVNHELESRGISVNRNVCEHFAFTRQELYHLIRVGQIHTFEDMLHKHGSGEGCEICKPLIGSILSSCWNGYVLSDANIGLQDTNDIYLGNMQKDGTYSVVPRIPGGEITPQGLIRIGEIAKQYNLYTKITGGQRIDLFGAQLHELPDIWRQLIDAGFETGQAYGKSVRTVKSCVGETWCRYGVDDSVGLAIEIENRYKGLRAPHKLKFAVSGCTRECAEAQSKDFGIIATENGWNLYVCGNGGMKPRHAELFATDLDKDTLIRLIDRLLMFYIRTADRLQRTSVWRENLEGGLDYLKQVILEDSLGINAELEAEMALNIGNYECEWAKTLESPEKLKRFRHFINSEQTDDNLQFVSERGQRRPANAIEKQQLIAKAS
ncbi:nitrite reductase large subunit NirB [Pokkaliibacter sp. CJK22405]|uniref:nitrite reductase large subunit NirB n=1 Tax=Pokkaliibacter sp. CJK22405 TaxID=3384615 RepID=UPI003984D25D